MTSIIDTELKKNNLWPPIHASLEVYNRRKLAKADCYELIWRLIHVWESTIITLSSAISAHAHASSDKDKDRDRKIRELCYGVTFDEVDLEIEKRGQGAFDGSINEWISILHYIASQPSNGVDFVSCVSQFLNSDKTGPTGNKFTIDLSKLSTSLNRVCSVSFSKDTMVDIKSAFRYVNQFRNKIAHVPFPYDRINEVFDAFRLITEKLFECSAYSGNPLYGSFITSSCILRGTLNISEDAPNDLSYSFKLKDDNEIWSAKPFVYIDPMMRPYVMTRLLVDQNTVEYTRYFAEGNSVVEIADSNLVQLFPQPTPQEYGQVSNVGICVEPEATKEIPDKSQDIRLLIRNRDYDKAIICLEEETKKNPNYHVNWERLGYAYREKAMLFSNGVSNPVEYLLKSIECFKRALGHSADGFKAQVYYQCSKSFLRLFQIDSKPEYLNDAKEYADKAITLDFQYKYVTWHEYVFKYGE